MSLDLFPSAAAAMPYEAVPEAQAAEAARTVDIRFRYFRSIDEAEPAWRALEQVAVHSAYQRLDWMRTWQQHLGARMGLEPLIVVGTNAAGDPLVLFPLGTRRTGPVRMAHWLGGKHSNYNLGLYDPRFLSATGPRDLAAMMRRIARDNSVDAFVLLNQPLAWQGYDNPFAALPRQKSANTAWLQSLHGDYAQLLSAIRGKDHPKRMRWRERRLTEQGGEIRLERAASPEAAMEIAEIFLAQKHARFHAQRRLNAFDEPGAADFVRALARKAGSRGAPLELYALYAGEVALATCGGGIANGRFSCYFNSIAVSDLTRYSPGEVLITRLLQVLCMDKVRTFDLGVGDSPYKEQWCRREDMFDTFLATSVVGSAAIAGLRAAYRAKRFVKEHETVLRVLNRVRRDRVEDTADTAS